MLLARSIENVSSIV